MVSSSVVLVRFHKAPRLCHQALTATRSRWAQRVKFANQRRPERRMTNRITTIRMAMTIHFKMPARLLRKLPTERDGGAWSFSRLALDLSASLSFSWFLPPEPFSLASLSFLSLASLPSGSLFLPEDWV